MPLVIVGIGIVFLLILVTWFKLNAFISLLLTSFLVGILSGMNLTETLDSMLKGIGETLGKIVLILAFGAILGKQLEVSGAAHSITHRLIELIGLKRIQYALLITGFLIGLPMMYNAGFLVLIPLIYAFASTTKMPMIWLALPLCSALSVAHCFLPPHPAPTYVSFIYGANVNLVLLYGLIPMVPACLLGGILLSKFFRKLEVKPPAELFQERHFTKEELPGLGISVLTAILPVLLMLMGTVVDLVFGPQASKEGGLLSLIKFFSDANIALLTAVIFSIWSLGLRRGKKMDDLMKIMATSIGAVSMIILIIGAGGAFSQVLKDSNVTGYIKTIATGLQMNPLLMAFGIAAILRLAIGSATVSTLTTAPIVLPIAQQTGISPELMVLATGAGSVMWSHFNDTGFWMFKEYFNLTIKQTFLSWTMMECIIGISGIITVLLLNLVI
jgi:gluconate transporter